MGFRPTASRASRSSIMSEESLLRSIVDVALESRPFRVGRGDDSGPGRSNLVELRLELGREALVLDGEPDRRADGRHEPGISSSAGSWTMTAIA